MKDKILKLLEKKIIKNFIHLFLGSTFASIIGILNTALLIKAIGILNNGIIFLGLSYVSFFNTMFNFQSYDAIIKFLPRYMNKDEIKTKNYIKQALFLDIITAIIAFAMSRLFLDSISEYFKWNIITLKTIKMLSWIILLTLTGCFSGILRIYEKFKYISFISIITNIVNFCFINIGIFTKQKLEYYVIMYLILNAITLLVTMYFIFKTLNENKLNRFNLFNISFDKEFIKFTIYTNISSTLDLPVTQLTPFVINRYLGISDIAIYKILEKLGEVIKRVTNIIGQAITPEISKKLALGDKKGVLKIAFQLGYLTLFTGILGMIFIFLTKDLWLYYFIPNYREYLKPLYLYLCFVIFTQMFIAQHPIFIYSGYVKENTIILLFVNTIYIILLIILIKRYHLLGVITSGILQALFVFLLKGIILKVRNR